MLILKYNEGAFGCELVDDIPYGSESKKAAQRKLRKLAQKYRLPCKMYVSGALFVHLESRRAHKRFQEFLKEANGAKFQRSLLNNCWR